MLSAYERPEKTVLTDLVVAEWLYSITDPDSRMLLESRRVSHGNVTRMFTEVYTTIEAPRLGECGEWL